MPLSEPERRLETPVEQRPTGFIAVYLDVIVVVVLPGARPCKREIKQKAGPFGAAALQASGDRGREEGGPPQR